MDKLPKDLKKEIIQKLYQDPTVPQSDIVILKLINREFQQMTTEVEDRNQKSKIKKELLETLVAQLSMDMNIRSLTLQIEHFIQKLENRIHGRKVAFDIGFGNDRITFEWNEPNVGNDFISTGSSSDKKLEIVLGKGITSSSDNEVATLLKKTKIEQIVDSILKSLNYF